MYRKNINLNLKLILRSPIYYIAFIFTIACYAFFAYLYSREKYTPDINFFYAFNKLTYVEVVMYILLFCVSVYFAQQKCTLEQSCFIPKQKIYLSKLFSVYLSSTIYFLIPILYMSVSCIIQKIGAEYLLVSLLFAVIRWSEIILMSQTIGFTVGYISQSFYSYLFAIPFTILNTSLNRSLFEILFNGNESFIFSHLFSLQKMYGNGTVMEFRGPVIDALFGVKLITVIVFCAAMILMLKNLCKKKICFISGVASSVCIIAIVFLSVIYCNLHPKMYYDEEKLYITDYESQSCNITGYTGKINLKELSSYDLDISFTNTGNANTVTLRLDESIKIKSLTINNKQINYERNGDLITFDAEKNNFTLNIKATGRISYVSSATSMNIYTSVSGCALPTNFAFLPKIDGDRSEKAYDLVITSNKILVSNLDLTQNGNIYTANDTAKDACFFSGYFTSDEYDGMTVYRANYNVKTNYMQVYRDYRERSSRYFDHETNSLIEGMWEEKPKVFMINYMYGTNAFAAPFDDYVMLTYGFMS